MDFFVTLLFNSVLLGVGLAMDAFSVSLANGLNHPKMKLGKMCFVAGVFAIFQAAMPLLGWVLVKTVCTYFTFFQLLIPWIALCLLSYIGGKMLYEGIKSNKETNESEEGTVKTLGFSALMLQGIATSIDALSVGFTISDYNFLSAFSSALIIAAVTFVICMIGVSLGKKAGTALSGKAGILGGAILIFIGLEIFISSWF